MPLIVRWKRIEGVMVLRAETMRYKLVCSSCNSEYDMSYKSQICSRCNGILRVEYYYNDITDKDLQLRSYRSLTRVLPKSNYGYYILGDTKLLRDIKDKALYLKLETENPTRSFKDRGSIVEISKAIDYNYKEIVCASTGNMAYSLSYYSRINKIKARVYISKDAVESKIDLIRSNNAEIVNIDGDFTKAQEEALKYSISNNAFLTGDYCYRMEGQRVVTLEIFKQMRALKKSVDNIILPVGNATLLSATEKAIDELYRFKLIRDKPTVIAVQSAQCDPFVKAYEKDRSIEYVKPSTIADAIAVGYPTFGDSALEWLKENNGYALSVSDKELVEARDYFAGKYNLIIETASASVIAAYNRIRDRLDGYTVAIITGANE
ncbi:MAG: threonine synthase [Candidatus Micrarchaeota archaeon]|nr:MAG: threonine synthase [Candidatus Micrarchaeota archaeon]